MIRLDNNMIFENNNCNLLRHYIFLYYPNVSSDVNNVGEREENHLKKVGIGILRYLRWILPRAKSYTVLYTKDGNKKRKIFHEGNLIVKKSVGSSCTTVLCDENQQELRKSTDNSTSKSYAIGDEFMFGIYLIQIEEVAHKSEEIENKVNNTPIPARSLPQNPTAALGKQPFRTPRPLAPVEPPIKSPPQLISEIKEETPCYEENPVSNQQPVIGRSSIPAFRAGSITASILQASKVNRPMVPFRAPVTRPLIPVPCTNTDTFVPSSIDSEQPKVENEPPINSSSLTTYPNNLNSMRPPNKPLLTSRPLNQSSSGSAVNPALPNSNNAIQPMIPSYKPVTDNILENKKVNVQEIVLDRILQKVMKEHQIIGANFLLDCILRKPYQPSQDTKDSEDQDDHNDKGKTSSKIHWSDSEEDEEDEIVSDRKNTRRTLVQSIEEHEIHGAILADEMGLGKTLTTISVLWTLISLQLCKVVIVCPSSLIDNWCAEIKKWLGMKLSPLVIRAGSDVNSIINTFAISRIAKFPLLILSYDKLRKCVDLLNNVSLLHLLVCDEGHRLKNIDGTKTIQALKDCKCHMRIVLTGTPIQNDLDELYALVNFVSPGLLGSVSNFKSMYAIYVQDKANRQLLQEEEEEDTSFHPFLDTTAMTSSSSASSKTKILHSEVIGLLAKVMLRRTQNDILRKLLPPRHDFIITCTCTFDQAFQYDHCIEELQKNLQVDTALDQFYHPEDVEDVQEKMREDEDIHNEDEDQGSNEEDDDDDDEEGVKENEDNDGDVLCDTDDESDGEAVSSRHKKRKHTEKVLIKEEEEDDDEAEQHVTSTNKRSKNSPNDAKLSSHCVLPALLSLRQISIASVPTSSTSLSHSAASHHRSGQHKTSSKLQFVDALLSTLYTRNQQQQQQLSSATIKTNMISPSSKSLSSSSTLPKGSSPSSGREKVVIVSGFRTVLDQLERLIQQKGWGNGYFRLDGSVPIEQRQGMVDTFNKPSIDATTPWIFLLSLRAGGVGINLIGANRLVMMDIDWNPAHDLQAMSRIWRQGQQKSVYIYRLITYGTIEEAMLHRQNHKSALSDLIDQQDTAGNTSSASAKTKKGAFKLTAKDLQALIYPRKQKAMDIMKQILQGGAAPTTTAKVKNSLDHEDGGIVEEDPEVEALERQERILSVDPLLQSVIHQLGNKWLKDIDHGEEYFASDTTG